MPNPLDVFLGELSEATDIELSDAILPIQTVDIDNNRVWEYIRVNILSSFFKKRGHLFGSREPRQTDKREGQPTFFIQTNDAQDELVGLWFYTGLTGADWLELAGLSTTTDAAELPDLATESQMAVGTLTTRVGVSPHLVHSAIPDPVFEPVVSISQSITGAVSEEVEIPFRYQQVREPYADAFVAVIYGSATDEQADTNRMTLDDIASSYEFTPSTPEQDSDEHRGLLTLTVDSGGTYQINIDIE